MKRLIKFLINKFVDFIKWIWQECKDWRTFVLLVVVCLVVGFPVWGGYLLYFITHWNWALIVATALLAFWWLPGAPYFAVCVAITLAIKKFFERRKARLKKLIEKECEKIENTVITNDDASGDEADGPNDNNE